MSISVKTIVAAVSFVLLFTACHRDKHYICICTTANSVSSHTIGRTTSDRAYAECQSYMDSTNNCYMEVRK